MPNWLGKILPLVNVEPQAAPPAAPTTETPATEQA
jgi:hypothetical protein